MSEYGVIQWTIRPNLADLYRRVSAPAQREFLHKIGRGVVTQGRDNIAAKGWRGFGRQIADGMNEKVHVLRRKPLEYLYSFGSGGRLAGQFYGTHSIETDRSGNIYTTETYEGKRVQKFRYVGMGNPTGDVGVAWPQ